MGSLYKIRFTSIESETKKSALFYFKDLEQMDWLPKKLIKIDRDECIVHVPEWLVKDHELEEQEVEEQEEHIESTRINHSGRSFNNMANFFLAVEYKHHGHLWGNDDYENNYSIDPL